MRCLQVQVLCSLPPGRLLTGYHPSSVQLLSTHTNRTTMSVDDRTAHGCGVGDMGGGLKIWNTSTWAEERALGGHEQKVGSGIDGGGWIAAGPPGGHTNEPASERSGGQ